MMIKHANFGMNDRGSKSHAPLKALRSRGLLFTAAFLCFAVFESAGQEARPALITGDHGTGGVALGIGSTAGTNVGELTNLPISSGDTVHISVFDAPDFSITTRVSEAGDAAYPILGMVHLQGMDSTSAANLIARQLKEHDLMADPHVLVTVDGSSSWITVLGEVHNPGIYPPLGKHQLSDVLAAAGGLTANTGRVIEIANTRIPDKKVYVVWDPTMHNTASYDRSVQPGDRIIVRACGIAYVGGHVAKPGAYSLCGSSHMTLSEVIALAGGTVALTSEKNTFIIRSEDNGTRTVQKVDLHKVLHARAADPIVKEDDVIYVSPSPLKGALSQIALGAMAIAPPLLYVYHP